MIRLFKNYFNSFVKDEEENIYIEFGHWAMIFQNRKYDPPVIVINIDAEEQTATEFTPLDMYPQPKEVMSYFFGSEFMDMVDLPDKIFIGTKTANVNILYWGLDIIPSNPKSTLRFKEQFYSIFPPTLPTAWQIDAIKLLDLETNKIIDASTGNITLFIVSKRLSDSFGIFKPFFYRDNSIAKYPFVRTTFSIRYPYVKGIFHLNFSTDNSSFELQSSIGTQNYLEKIIVDVVLKRMHN